MRPVKLTTKVFGINEFVKITFLNACVSIKFASQLDREIC